MDAAHDNAIYIMWKKDEWQLFVLVEGGLCVYKGLMSVKKQERVR